MFVVGVLNSGIPFACYSYALLSITTGLSAILNATVPLFGALVAWLWLKDRPTGSRVLGLAIGFAGVALLAWDKASFKPDASGAAPGWAVIACLLATFCYGLAASATKRYLSGVPALVTATGSQLGATLGLALPALWFWPAQMPSPQAWLSLVAVGVLCTGIAYVLYFRLIEQARTRARAGRDLRGAGVRGVLRRAVPGRKRHRLDAAVRAGHRVRHGLVDRVAEAAGAGGATPMICHAGLDPASLGAPTSPGMTATH